MSHLVGRVARLERAAHGRAACPTCGGQPDDGGMGIVRLDDVGTAPEWVAAGPSCRDCGQPLKLYRSLDWERV